MRLFLSLKPDHLSSSTSVAKHLKKQCSHLERVPALNQFNFDVVRTDFLELDLALAAPYLKISVVRVQPGQPTEDVILSNGISLASGFETGFLTRTLPKDDSSPEFRKFLSILGEQIELRGWKGYAANLNTKDDSDGKYSLLTRFQGFEIMWHVAPMIPPSGEHQVTNRLSVPMLIIFTFHQIGRKRLVCNNISMVLFLERGARFEKNIFSSQFVRTFRPQPMVLAVS